MLKKVDDLKVGDKVHLRWEEDGWARGASFSEDKEAIVSVLGVEILDKLGPHYNRNVVFSDDHAFCCNSETKYEVIE